ncbi:MAG: hypothetical protein RJA53_1532 [Bacteroidota bacterium]|jgi:hypothetical protein
MKIDYYTLKARIYPSFIILLPLLLLAIYYITDFEIYFHYLTAVVSIGLFSYLLSQLGRDRGKLKEQKLFKIWGGKPSTQILRHSSNLLDKHTKARFHKILGEKINNIILPSEEEERKNPSESDEIYESCTKYLISKTRDTTKYTLLLKENTSYGFRRNLWGMKIWAIIILIISFIIHAIIATDYFTNYSFKPSKDAYLYTVLFFDFIFWMFIVTPKWIRIVAEEYARRLYETLED